MMKIIYEDSEIIVCHKMPGVPVQTARTRQQDMVSMLRNYLVDQGEAAEIYVIRRLDQPVEGIMVFAKNKKSAASLSKQIQEKGMDKYYYAVLEGVMEPPEGILTDFLLRDGKSNTSSVVTEGTKNAKKAVLSYRTLQFWEEKSLVKICLHTGRHHQIRCQLAKMGCPIKGDLKYGSPRSNPDGSICLHARRVRFIHPVSKELIELEAPLPEGNLWKGFAID